MYYSSCCLLSEKPLPLGFILRDVATVMGIEPQQASFSSRQLKSLDSPSPPGLIVAFVPQIRET